MFPSLNFAFLKQQGIPEIQTYIFNKNLQREWLKIVQVAIDQFRFLEQAVSRALCIPSKLKHNLWNSSSQNWNSFFTKENNAKNLIMGIMFMVIYKWHFLQILQVSPSQRPPPSRGVLAFKMDHLYLFYCLCNFTEFFLL